MMSHQGILWILIFTVCGVTPLIHAQDSVHCFNLEYTGPVKDVIKMKPTKLAESTSEAAQVVQGLAVDMATLAIESIPVAGTFLGALFGQIADVYGLAGGDDLDPQQVYDDLKEEIDQLREYMDEQIIQAKLDYIAKAFGTTRGGIMSYAMHCQRTFKGDAEDMAPCLENVHAMLTQQYHFFMPSDSKVSSYEFSLPLFRMYGELFVDTLLEQIGVARKRGKESQAIAQADNLIKKVQEFKEHYENSLKKIVELHVEPHRLKDPDCAVLPHTTVQMCVCTLTLGPNKVSSEEIKKKDQSTKNFCLGVFYNSVRNACEETKDGYASKFAKEHLQAIITYWTKQVGNMVDTWVKTADALKQLKANVKR